MTKYNPPIESRETDELIIISQSSTEEWQQEAIDIAMLELNRRGYNQAQIASKYAELESEVQIQYESEMQKASTEDFSIIEKILIVLFWPKELLRNWNLKQEGYFLKAKHRIQLIGIGILFYLILLLIKF